VVVGADNEDNEDDTKHSKAPILLGSKTWVCSAEPSRHNTNRLRIVFDDSL
jgi:hypothetical protein